MKMSPNSMKAIHDILAEIHFCITCMNYLDSDSETKKWIKETNSIAWDIIDATNIKE